MPPKNTPWKKDNGRLADSINRTVADVRFAANQGDAIVEAVNAHERLKAQRDSLLAALKDVCARLAPPNHTELTVGKNFGPAMQMAYRRAMEAIAAAEKEG